MRKIISRPYEHSISFIRQSQGPVFHWMITNSLDREEVVAKVKDVKLGGSREEK
jgi:hypothetical protein